MTSNEKKVLMKFKEIKQGNTVTIAGTLRVTINYAYDVCKKLCEKGYIERLSPGRFALYKITPLGEDAAADYAEKRRERREIFADSADNSAVSAVAEIEEYECTNCGASVKEDDTECPKCGVVFEEVVEEEEATEGNTERSERVAEAPDFPQDKPCEEVPSSTQQNPKVGEESANEGSDNVNEKRGILNHPSVPEDWKTCNWKWK